LELTVSEKKLKNREFTAEFKARVVLELVRGDLSLSQASAKHSVQETTLSRWKQEFIERSSAVFMGSPSEQDLRIRELERQLKSQETDLAILKKALLLFPTQSESEQ
jgi:transposase